MDQFNEMKIGAQHKNSIKIVMSDEWMREKD